MTENIQFVKHNSIKIVGSKVVYIDPYKIDQDYRDADYIFCTHSHYDHFSPEDIEKIKKSNTKIITVKDVKVSAEKLVEDVMVVEPNKEYVVECIKFETTYAYNINKHFHPKENGWVGFLIDLDNIKYFIAGDTDNVPEIRNIKCDIALIPVGGTYTMNVEDAVELANSIETKVVIPTHYGVIVGESNAGKIFAESFRTKHKNNATDIVIYDCI